MVYLHKVHCSVNNNILALGYSQADLLQKLVLEL